MEIAVLGIDLGKTTCSVAGLDSSSSHYVRGLTPYEYICKIWTSEPDRFIVDPIHQMPGLNT